MHRYIFDVDGTLTPSRGRMDGEFANWFEHFATHHAVYLVTGSDREKTLEQIPYGIYNLCVKVYQCSGNDVWEQSHNISTSPIELTQNIIDDLNGHLTASKFYSKTGHHIDYRPGLVNFSIVGHGCTLEQRVMYRQWDDDNQERRTMSYQLKEKYPDFNFQVAGETGIDITKVGYGKEQIVHDFSPHDTIKFFGDKMDPGGNDYDLALELIRSGQCVYHVKSWEETWKILKEL